jgi:hypothetical protein
MDWAAGPNVVFAASAGAKASPKEAVLLRGAAEEFKNVEFCSDPKEGFLMLLTASEGAAS